MRNRASKNRVGLLVAVLGTAAVVTFVPSPAAATPAAAAVTAVDSPIAGVRGGGAPHEERCLREMRDMVIENNAAFQARDVDRYRATLNPELIVDRDGSVTYGRHVAVDKAAAFFQVPGWTWNTTILSATVYGCTTGVAILDAHQIGPDAYDYHAHVAMTMTRKHGSWTVAMDYVHLIEKTPLG